MPAPLFDGLQAHRTSFIPIFERFSSLVSFELFVVPFDEEATSLNILQVQKVVAQYIQQHHLKVFSQCCLTDTVTYICCGFYVKND
jgi:hypothetical protein